MKRCNKCGLEYEATLEYFYRDSSKCDGLCTTCKSCKRTSNRAWIEKNKERYTAYKRRYAIENADVARQRVREWRLANPEREKENHRKWEARNRDYVNAKHRQLNKRSDRKLLKAVYKHKRRAKEHGLGIQITKDDWLRCLEHFDHKCAVCGRNPKDHKHLSIAMDHWIPLSSPQSLGTVPKNVVPLCHGRTGCNNKKSYKDPYEWLQEVYDTDQAQAIYNRIQSYFDLVS